MPLLVKARGAAMVPRFDALNSSPRRFTGRSYDKSLGVAGGWPAKTEPEEVPDLPEFRRAVARGDLWAADQATADACGVALDPTFGGEK